jgi:hypothetical protein
LVKPTVQLSIRRARGSSSRSAGESQDLMAFAAKSLRVPSKDIESGA